jgi:hypothetical protein
VTKQGSHFAPEQLVKRHFTLLLTQQRSVRLLTLRGHATAPRDKPDQRTATI